MFSLWVSGRTLGFCVCVNLYKIWLMDSLTSNVQKLKQVLGTMKVWCKFYPISSIQFISSLRKFGLHRCQISHYHILTHKIKRIMNKNEFNCILKRLMQCRPYSNVLLMQSWLTWPPSCKSRSACLYYWWDILDDMNCLMTVWCIFQLI